MMLSAEFKVKKKSIFYNKLGILNDLKNGVNYLTTDGTYSQFSGMKGYIYIFETFLSNFGDTRTDTYGYNISAEAMNTQGTTMYDSLATFKTTYGSSTV